MSRQIWNTNFYDKILELTINYKLTILMVNKFILAVLAIASYNKR